MTIARPLPASYYEYLANTRPHILREVDRLAVIAAEKGVGPHFRTIDDFDGDIKDVMRDEQVCQAKLQGLGRRYTDEELAYDMSVPPHIRAQMALMIDRDLSMLMAHRLAGMAIYRLSDGLASRLANTTMNMPTELMKLPHTSIMLVLDDERSITSFQAMFKNLKGKGAVTVFIRETNDERGRIWSISSMQAHNKQIYGQTVRCLDCSPGRDAEAALQTDWGARGISDPRIQRIAATANSKITTNDVIHYTAGLDFYRIVLNAVFYIMSHKPSMSPPRRNQGRLANDRVNFCGRVHVTLGDGMTILDKRVKTSSDRACLGSVRSGRMLEGIQRVMGHWKVQAYGPGSTLRRIIFVEPYYRGNDAADLVVKAAAVA